MVPAGRYRPARGLPSTRLDSANALASSSGELSLPCKQSVPCTPSASSAGALSEYTPSNSAASTSAIARASGSASRAWSASSSLASFGGSVRRRWDRLIGIEQMEQLAKSPRRALVLGAFLDRLELSEQRYIAR